MTEDLRTLAEPTFADLTTLRVGGDMDTLVRTTTEAELIDAVRAADDAGEPVLILGGGSNLLVADEGFSGVVIQDQRSGLRVESADSCGGANLTAPAGHSMDELVAEVIDRGWVGVESLSGIPGTVGAAPVQNIGAYGQEISGSVANVRVWDRGRGRVRTLSLVDLDFGYRTSMLKRSTQMPHSRAGEPGDVDPRAPWYPSPRYVVLDVSFQLRIGTLSTPIVYPELARRLGVEEGARAETSAVRDAVLELRGSKGMLLDTGDQPDYDRWSAGSFFTNPIIPADLVADLPEGVPVFPVRTATPTTTTGPALGTIDPSVVKVSAAWLIERAGFGKGYGVDGPDSAARVSTRHTLALTNRGHATANDIVRLAREVRGGVDAAFGIELVPEPVLVGVSL
ncbi:UDP-N-acetylmuramate dehydrogenase [Sanguibacter inulinus]|uniref:UDP-N-acetylenolpyruvoylglucosamine reductase n=1 Tax=Sanguibacter inulinus TaxID=60922 RepID=A0A853ESQ0_9MICO|nr:UDP-N-acetylmuramate dehydrogenase [Sanguibacter inulinus]MBF0722521.1 UDP-N-acetylmuramate dehydrogenase [Sanguibacter inulinus]NYS93666.1 UDP-N-acetylmuramate dehydrogenase [Sanguibacter inulinus]